MKHRARNFRDIMTFLDLAAPPRISTTLLGRVRRTKGRCSNCGKHPSVALFTRGAQICAGCISRAQDTFAHPAIRMALIRRARMVLANA